ncbi:MAG: HD domain-containing protein [Bacteroidales bacterium]|nr:HD domain-containing protein [Bacteroidales bacterium]
MNPDLREYIATNIIPRYGKFDQGHAVSHVTKVMERALCLACRYDVNPDMVYTAAAYHDLGIAEDRKTHNIISARMIREDSALSQWFSPEQIDIIADAAEDHCASLGYEPRTIYGKITAEADRLIFPDMVVERCIQYGRAKHPDLDKEAQWERVAAHLEEKYGRNGYLKVWLPESSNAVMLDKLRDIIDDKRALREMFDKLYR